METTTNLPAVLPTDAASARPAPMVPERTDFLEGDAPAAAKVEAFLARALEATGSDASSTAGALVPWICDALLSNHSVKAYDHDLSFGPAAALPPGPGSPSTRRCRATR
jgi:hypothetical protein